MLELVVLYCAFAAATASAPFYTAPLAVSSFPITYGYAYPYARPYNYRGPLSLAPGQPADILGTDGRPLDTLEVNQDRAAHFAAQTGLHILKKRSADKKAAYDAARNIVYAAPLPILPYSANGYIYPYLQPFNYRGPFSLAPGQPAEILGSDGRPLDTLEVNQDRAAHLAAKTGLDVPKKRAISIAAAPLAYIAHFLGRPTAFTSPVSTGLITPVITPVTNDATSSITTQEQRAL